jgi:hypothetical protein
LSLSLELELELELELDSLSSESSSDGGEKIFRGRFGAALIFFFACCAFSADSFFLSTSSVLSVARLRLPFIG